MLRHKTDRMTLNVCRLSSVSAFLLIALSSCATPGVLEPPTPRPEPRVEPVGAVLEPSRNGALWYGGTSPARTMSDFRLELDRRLGVAGDDRLDRAAEDLVDVFIESGDVPYRAVEFLLHHYGVAEPAPGMVSIKTRAKTAPQVAKVVAGHLEDTLQRRRPRRYGAALRKIRGGHAVVVMMQENEIQLRPIRRRRGSKDVIEVRGSLPVGFTRPVLFRTDPAGVVEQPVVVVEGRRFHGAFPCRTGRNQVELTGEGRLGVTVLANFPVFCGVEPPASLTLETEASEKDASDAQLARRVFELANQERSQAGLHALAWSEPAAEVSIAHSEDMMSADFVGHVSPTTGGPADRVLRSGIRVSMVLENVARAPSAADAHTGLMNSPGHRANILSEEATHLGVGVRRRENGELLVTQVFLRVPKAMDLSRARTELERKVDALRRRRGRTPWSVDRALQEAASRHADALAQGRGKAEPPRPTGLQGRYRQLVTVIEVVGSVGDFVGKSVERRGPAGFGIGVAQGEHKELGRNVLYVVILIGIPAGAG